MTPEIIELDEEACSLLRRIATLELQGTATTLRSRATLVEDHFTDINGEFYRAIDKREHKRLKKQLDVVEKKLDEAQEREDAK